jgi:alpha-methylacyl-CoA racemase
MMGGLGPAPFCGMLLGDLGADVVRVDQLARAVIVRQSAAATTQ